MRITPHTIRKAAQMSPNILRLLPAARTLDEAKTELRWIQADHPDPTPKKIAQACYQRGRYLTPLQYVIGNQPFGSLHIDCRPNVLIPRSETEEWACHVSTLLKTLARRDKDIRLVDLCTGTGCIALQMATAPLALVAGIDVSPYALDLAEHNEKLNHTSLRAGKVIFEQADILDPKNDAMIAALHPNIITANPPYVSHEVDAAQAVKKHEPKLAVFGGNEFYEAIIRITKDSGAEALVTEVGYLDQAKYTQSLLPSDWSSIVFKDFSDRPRAVFAWKKGTQYDLLGESEGGGFNVVDSF
ncbi:Mitochondrial N(5)-glutamine methyltransferase MTQ1 [Yarrowia sp. B02]|nr:Mitochondrial N(5)-glutamine methyltransferase MTQ1 [Yarrowia sp. B02]